MPQTTYTRILFYCHLIRPVPALAKCLNEMLEYFITQNDQIPVSPAAIREIAYHGMAYRDRIHELLATCEGRPERMDCYTFSSRRVPCFTENKYTFWFILLVFQSSTLIICIVIPNALFFFSRHRAASFT